MANAPSSYLLLEQPNENSTIISIGIHHSAMLTLTLASRISKIIAGCDGTLLVLLLQAREALAQRERARIRLMDPRVPCVRNIDDTALNCIHRAYSPTGGGSRAYEYTPQRCCAVPSAPSAMPYSAKYTPHLCSTMSNMLP